MTVRIWTLVVTLGLLFSVSPGWTYEEISVSNGGTIQGKITITGDKPRPMAFNLVTIPDAESLLGQVGGLWKILSLGRMEV